MKIRHKQTGVVLEGEFIDAGVDYKERAPGGYSLYYKKVWEAVPEWVDVTSQCDLLEGMQLWHGDKCIADLAFGYKFRAVCSQHDGKQYAAFIVERKS